MRRADGPALVDSRVRPFKAGQHQIEAVHVNYVADDPTFRATARKVMASNSLEADVRSGPELICGNDNFQQPVREADSVLLLLTDAVIRHVG
jgi:hypothetical protein